MPKTKLPDERPSITHKFRVGGMKGYITVGLYDDATPGEVFLQVEKVGSLTRGAFAAVAVLISMALQNGIPLSEITSKLRGQTFDPSGLTNSKDIPMAKSILDYVARWMELKFLFQEPEPKGEPNE